MDDNNEPVSDKDERPETFVEGRDFYFEGSLMVLARRYLLNRGFCCGNQCRHCPYDEKI